MNVRQIIMAQIQAPMTQSWSVPAYLRHGDKQVLAAWFKTFVEAIAALDPTEEEARAAFLAVSQSHRRADWPAASAFCAAIRKGRPEGHT